MISAPTCMLTERNSGAYPYCALTAFMESVFKRLLKDSEFVIRVKSESNLFYLTTFNFLFLLPK